MVALAVLTVLEDVAKAEGAKAIPDTLVYGAGIALLVAELATPDVRLELSGAEQDPSWLLSWPIAIPFAYVGADPDRFDGGSSGYAKLYAFVEPQLRLADSVLRGLVGGRAELRWSRRAPGRLFIENNLRVGPLLEGGFAIAEDGNGPFLGAGVAVGPFAVVYRFTYSRPHVRQDFCIEVNWL